MLEEAINRLVELGQDTKGVTPIPCPGDPKKTLLVSPDGTIQPYNHEPPSRKHRVANVDSLKRCVDEFGEEVAIWVSFENVVAVLDDDDHRDNTVTLNLNESPVFNSIISFGETDDPKKFLRFIKHECNGATIDPSDLDFLISDLKFRTEDELNRQTGKTNDSMGHSIRSQVTGAEKIPDLVTFRFLPWPGIEEEFQAEISVPCQLYIDPTKRTISLSPLPGMIDAAKTQAVSHLAKQIESAWSDDKLTIICGKP